MDNVPYFEDISSKYFFYSMSEMFPKTDLNQWPIFITGVFHLLGALILQYGPYLLLPEYLFTYLIYAAIIICMYWVFDNNCFMTLLTNYFAGRKTSPLNIRFSLFKNIIYFNILACIIGILYPTFAPVNWMNLLKLYL